jgi:hypothetical protein
LPDEPHREADQQGLHERLVAPKLILEPRSDDPGENTHRDGGRRPHRKDLSKRVLPDGRIPFVAPVGRMLDHQRLDLILDDAGFHDPS